VLCPTITFVIFTYNEEKRLSRVLENFAHVGPLLIVDNESTDGTLEIARRYGASILINKNEGWVEDEKTVERVKKAVQTEWIYWAFADELIGHDTIDAIRRAISENKYDIINIARKNYYYGRFCHNAFADRMNRIFKPHAIDFSGNVIHSFGRTTVPIDRIKMLPDRYFVHHFISNVAKSYILTMDRYTDLHAAPILSKSPLRLIGSSLKLAFIQFFKNGGWKAGRAGAFLTANCAFYNWMLSMKSFELRHNIDRAEIERINDKTRDEILSEIKRR